MLQEFSRVGWAAVAVLAVAVGLAPARGDEEEEPMPKKPTKKVVVVEDDTPTGGANVLPDVARAANAEKHPVLKKYLSGLSVACDRIDLGNKTLRVLPLPLVWGKDKYPDEFGIAALNEQNKAGEVQSLGPKDVRGMTHFEPLALAETDRLLKSTAADAPPMPDRLAAAEKVLTAALFFHDSALDAGRRRGKSWEPFKAGIIDKLTEVRIGMVKLAAERKKWDDLAKLVTKYAERYRNSPKVMQELLGARLFEAVELVKSERLADLEKARDILSDFESKFPNTGNEQAKQVKEALIGRGKKFMEEVQRLQDSGNTTEARNQLRNIEAINPDQPQLREKQRELKAGYSTLVVGVKRMPRFMSPATAREDSEKMAVELLFEGLTEPTPDPALGTLYRPVLALAKPRVPAPLARELQLVGNADWGRKDTGAFDAADLVETVRMMRDKRHLPSAERVDWIEPPALDPSDPNRVRIKLKQGHPDPRELLGFKVLPGKFLAGKNTGIDDDSPAESFARLPFGTGPYKFPPEFKPADGPNAVKDVWFEPNGNYWRRPGKIGQPAIKEVRFLNLAAVQDPVNEIRGDRLHLMTDVPTKDLSRYTALAKVTVVTPTVNRRVWMLAINHATIALQNVDVRRGLSLAVDREKILDEVFRAGTKEYHKALTGPYPVGCWCEPQVLGGPPRPLFDPNLAQAKLRTVGDGLSLSLLYPNDDPQAKEACEKMKAQIEAAGRVTIDLEPVSPVELWTRVQKETRYDLAYVPFDYPDIWFAHALAAFLDPTAAGKGGRNYLNYLVKSTNPTKWDDGVNQMLAAVKEHRDVKGKLDERSKDLATRFNEAVPFVPLWQLDRHVVASTSLKVFLDREADPVSPKLLDPVKVFSNVGRWRMDDTK